MPQVRQPVDVVFELLCAAANGDPLPSPASGEATRFYEALGAMVMMQKDADQAKALGVRATLLVSDLLRTKCLADRVASNAATQNGGRD